MRKEDKKRWSEVDARSDSGMFDMHYDYSIEELECIDDMKLEVIQVDAYETGRIKFHRYYLITLFSGDEVVYRSGRESNEERTWHIYDTIHNAMVMGDDLTADQQIILYNYARYSDYNFVNDLPDVTDIYDLFPIRDFERKAQRYMDMVMESLYECTKCYRVMDGQPDDEGVCEECQDDERAGIEYLGEMYQDIDVPRYIK